MVFIEKERITLEKASREQWRGREMGRDKEKNCMGEI
jgi:hypothetical protein